MENLMSLRHVKKYDRSDLIKLEFNRKIPNPRKVKRGLQYYVREVESIRPGSEGCGVHLGYFFTNYNHLRFKYPKEIVPVHGLTLGVFPLNSDQVSYQLQDRDFQYCSTTDPLIIRALTKNGEPVDGIPIRHYLLFSTNPVLNTEIERNFPNPRFAEILPGYEFPKPEK